MTVCIIHGLAKINQFVSKCLSSWLWLFSFYPFRYAFITLVLLYLTKKLKDSGILSFFLSSTFVYEPILIKISMNTNLSWNEVWPQRFMFNLPFTYVLIDDFLSLLFFHYFRLKSLTLITLLYHCYKVMEGLEIHILLILFKKQVLMRY